MDPLTHTLVGASLAQTRLGRVRLGAATLIVGANLPDIDAASYFIGSDLALGIRRGWTHGVLAIVLLPPLLGWVMHRFDRWRCRRDPAAAPAPLQRLIGLSYVAVLSHTALDWLNTYGVRLLMPFDGRWFYGDSLFIIDPWLWLLLGAVAVLGYSASRTRVAGWIALGVISTALVTGFPGTPAASRLLWCLGVGVIAGLRYWNGWRPHLPTVASVCLVLAVLYIGAMVTSTGIARGQAVAWARGQGLDPRRIMVGPTPANPFRRDLLIADDLHYHRVRLDWRADEPITPLGPQTLIGGDHEAAAAALTAPHVWGLAAWTRFPVFDVEPLGDGYRVTVTDMRFTREVVELDRNLRPRTVGR